MATTPEAAGTYPNMYTVQCAALREIQTRQRIQMFDVGLLGRAILAASSNIRTRMAETQSEWDGVVYGRPAIIRAGRTCIVDPRHIESGICFRSFGMQPRTKLYVPIALSSSEHPTVLPTHDMYEACDLKTVTMMATELLHAKVTDVLPNLSNDMTDIQLPGTYIG